MAQRSLLKISRGMTPEQHSTTWKWVSSGTVATGDFGDPTATTTYALCVYDQTGLLMTATAPAGGTCAGRACWIATSTGAKYANKTLVPDGLKQVSLKAGAAGQAKIAVAGTGANLPVPTLPLAPPVHVQLRRQDASTCWDATYPTGLPNTATTFKALSE